MDKPTFRTFGSKEINSKNPHADEQYRLATRGSSLSVITMLNQNLGYPYPSDKLERIHTDDMENVRDWLICEWNKQSLKKSSPEN